MTKSANGSVPPIRVVHVLAPARVGGLERVVEALARGQRERGIESRVAVVVEPGPDRHPFVEDLRTASVPVDVLQVPHRAYLREARLLARTLRKRDPDLVHTHGYRADVVAAAVARLLGLSTVSTVHGFTGGGWKNRLYEWLQRRSLARMDVVVPVSRRLGSELREGSSKPSRVEVVRNAWFPTASMREPSSARQELGLRDDIFVIGWVGRLSREKGADVLLRAMNQFATDDVSVCVLGEGSERSRLEDLAAALGIEDRLRLHGFVPRAEVLFPAFDVFVLSSRTEGTPVTLFEAMEAEIPVVATRVGGVPDVVRHEREALLVPSEEPGALAQAILRVRANPGAARERARRARRRLETEFSIDPWLDRYQEVYEMAMNST